MSGLLGAGIPVTERVTFNQGVLTLSAGGQQAVDLEKGSITVEVTEKPLRILGSILKQQIYRSSVDVTLEATVRAFSPEIFAFFFGSSTAWSGGQDINFVDGQVSLASPYLQFSYEKAGGGTLTAQYQFIGALITSIRSEHSAEDYGTYTITMKAKNLVVSTNL